MRNARYVALQPGALPIGGERLSSKLGVSGPLTLLPRMRNVIPGQTFSGRYLEEDAIRDMLALGQIAEDQTHA